MIDSQWPRYIVFVKANAEESHFYAGSVHAPDGEMALLNARDVFARRPVCVSVWVVPANRILTMTAEEFQSKADWLPQKSTPKKDLEMYAGFLKLTHRGTFTYAGEIAAESPEAALHKLIKTPPEAVAWWVFPASVITASTADDVDELFHPVIYKAFREQSFYHTVATLKELKSKPLEGAGDEA